MPDDIQEQVEAGKTLEEISAYIAERQEEKQRLNEYVAQRNAERLAESLEQAKAGNVEHHELFDPDKEEWTEFDPVAALGQLDALEAQDAALIRQAAFARRQPVTEFALEVLTKASYEVLSEDHSVDVPVEVYQRLRKEYETETGKVLTDANIEALSDEVATDEYAEKVYTTKSGKVLTEAEVDALASVDETKIDYDIEALKQQPLRARRMTRDQFHEAIQRAIDAAKRGEGMKVEDFDAFFDSL
jgi:hypothetical protein